MSDPFLTTKRYIVAALPRLRDNFFMTYLTFVVLFTIGWVFIALSLRVLFSP